MATNVERCALVERGFSQSRQEPDVRREPTGHEHDASRAGRREQPQVPPGHRLMNALQDVRDRDASRHHVDDVGLGEHGAMEEQTSGADPSRDRGPISPRVTPR